MVKLPIRTWVGNAAAVFSGQHGAVTRPAEQARCSRETADEQAKKVEQRLADSAAESAAWARLHAEDQRLIPVSAALRHEAEGRIRSDKAQRRERATTAFAMGLSLR